MERICQLLLKKYGDKPDDFPLSVGHWEGEVNPETLEVPRFNAYMCITVGELREAVDGLHAELKTEDDKLKEVRDNALRLLGSEMCAEHQEQIKDMPFYEFKARLEESCPWCARLALEALYDENKSLQFKVEQLESHFEDQTRLHGIINVLTDDNKRLREKVARLECSHCYPEMIGGQIVHESDCPTLCENEKGEEKEKHDA